MEFTSSLKHPNEIANMSLALLQCKQQVRVPRTSAELQLRIGIHTGESSADPPPPPPIVLQTTLSNIVSEVRDMSCDHSIIKRLLIASFLSTRDC